MDKNKEMIGLQKKPYPISTKEFAGFPVISDKKQIKIKHLIHLTQNVHSLITYYRSNSDFLVITYKTVVSTSFIRPANQSFSSKLLFLRFSTKNHPRIHLQSYTNTNQC